MLEYSCSLASQSDQYSGKKLLCAAALLWVYKQHSANILVANDPITLVSEIYILIFQNVVCAVPQWFIAILIYKYIYTLILMVFFHKNILCMFKTFNIVS